MSKDPVCGMNVDEGSQTRSTYEGKTYVFCCPSCKERFDKDPQRYAASRAGAGQTHSR